MKTARGRIIARRAFINPRVTLGDGDSEFYIVNSHIDKREIIVDPDMAQILGVMNLEFTNVLPATLADDLPLWLSSTLAVGYLIFGRFPLSEYCYTPILDSFLGILE